MAHGCFLLFLDMAIHPLHSYLISQLMTTLIRLFLPLLVLMSLVTFHGCQQKGCTDPGAINYDPEAEEDGEACSYPMLSLRINQLVGDEALTLNTDYQINGTVVQFETVNVYLDEIRLMDMDGTMSDMLPTTLLVTNEQATYEVGDITTGHKHMLMFGVGVDSATNHGTDPTTLAEDDPLYVQVPSMHWSWDMGYIFLRIDGQVDTDGDGAVDAPMELHIGRATFFTDVMLEAHSDAMSESMEIAVDFDMATLLAGLDLSTENMTHTGDNLPLARKVQANLASAFAIP